MTTKYICVVKVVHSVWCLEPTKEKKEAYQIAEKYGPKCKNLYVMRGQYCRDAIMNIPLQAGSMEYATFNDFEHVFVWVDDWTFDNMVKRKIITIIISTD